MKILKNYKEFGKLYEISWKKIAPVVDQSSSINKNKTNKLLNYADNDLDKVQFAVVGVDSHGGILENDLYKEMFLSFSSVNLNEPNFAKYSIEELFFGSTKVKMIAKEFPSDSAITEQSTEIKSSSTFGSSDKKVCLPIDGGYRYFKFKTNKEAVKFFSVFIEMKALRYKTSNPEKYQWTIENGNEYMSKNDIRKWVVD